ncbi:MAG: hypothetical protein WD003_01045 [Candidatus Paceibacterota bacterium]
MKRIQSFTILAISLALVVAVSPIEASAANDKKLPIKNPQTIGSVIFGQGISALAQGLQTGEATVEQIRNGVKEQDYHRPERINTTGSDVDYKSNGVLEGTPKTPQRNKGKVAVDNNPGIGTVSITISTPAKTVRVLKEVKL